MLEMHGQNDPLIIAGSVIYLERRRLQNGSIWKRAFNSENLEPFDVPLVSVGVGRRLRVGLLPLCLID